MAQFPKAEADIMALAIAMVSGFNDNTTVYPAPPVGTTDLSAKISAYNTQKTAAVAAAAAAAQATSDKDEALDDLIDDMKKDLAYAENTVGNDADKLKLIGWDGRKAKTPLAVPGQCRSLEAPREGEGWIFLDWKAPSDGGKVAAYNIQRRQRPEGSFQQVAMAMDTEITLHDQTRGVEWEYRVLAVNKAGQGEPSNTVMAVL